MSIISRLHLFTYIIEPVGDDAGGKWSAHSLTAVEVGGGGGGER